MINSSGSHRGKKHCHHMPFAINTVRSAISKKYCLNVARMRTQGLALPSLNPMVKKLGFFQWKQNQAMNVLGKER